MWDADNHLESVTVSSSTHSYEYDALGRRIAKTTGGTTTVFVSLTQPIPPLGTTGGQVIAEYNAGAAATNPLRETIFGSYVDEPLAIIDGPTGNIHYYHQNARFDVVALSGTAGAIAERYAYDAYGNTLTFDAAGANPRTNSALGNRFGFTGRELDRESGLYYFRARYYDCVLGRFIGRDPVGFTDGWNLFAAYFVPSRMDASGTVRILCSCASCGGGACVFEDVITECQGLGDDCCNNACSNAIPGGRLTQPGEWKIVPNTWMPHLPPKPDYSPCDGYDISIGSKCRRLECGIYDIPDQYPQKAKRTCRQFLEMYSFSEGVTCVAKCLVNEERSTRHIT